MSWNGSGVFTRVRNWVADKNNGIKIIASLHDQEDDNLSAGIQACLTKNNESKPVADFRPNADNSYNLGSATLRWVQGFFAGSLRLFNGASNYGELLAGTLTANRTYALPDSSGDIILKDGSGIVRAATGVALANSGFESTVQSAALTNNRAVTIPDDSGNIVLDNTPQVLANKSLGPEGTGSGQTGTLRLRELVANGTDSVAVRAADSMSASYTVTLPSSQGGSGTTLTNDGTGILTWQTPNSVYGPIGTSPGDAGRIQLRELAVNGTDVVRIKAPDSIASSFDLTMPSALPSVAGAGISFSTSGIGSFSTSPMATRQHADESAFIFQLILN